MVAEYFRIPDADFGYKTGPSWQRLLFYFTDGNHGVDVFFIISGFLMSRIVMSDRGHFSYFEFIKNRFNRIYPAFLVSLCVSAVVLCNWFGWTWEARDFLKNLIFMNAVSGYKVTAYNHVSWSLGFEFAFYLAIPILVVMRRIVDRRVASALLLCAAYWYIPDEYLRMKALFVGAVIGSFSDSHLKQFAKHVPMFVAIFAYLGCGVLKAVYFDFYLDYYYWFLAAAALAFVKIVWSDTNLVTRFFGLPLMRKLGMLSYSIYLYHSLILSVVLVKLTPRPASLGGAAWFVFTSALLTLVVAWLSYRLIESRYFMSHKRSVVTSKKD